MDATPISFDTATLVGGVPPASGASAGGEGEATDIRRKWLTLHAAAGTIAVLAGAPADGLTDHVHDFPNAVCALSPSRRAFAGQGVDDLVAILEPGLAALLAVHAAGADPEPAARALWHEFCAAREALIKLVV